MLVRLQAQADLGLCCLHVPKDTFLHCNGIARTELLTRTPRKKTLKNLASVASKIGVTLKGKNVLPEGAHSFL